MIRISKIEKSKSEYFANIIIDFLKKYRVKMQSGKMKNIAYKLEYENLINDIFKTLDILIMGNIEEVLKIYNNLVNKYPKFLNDLFSKDLTDEQKKFNNYIKKIFNYNQIIKKIAFELITEIFVKVCPYCNMNYTLYLNKRDKKTRPQFDHFYPKSIYPILSLSLCNIVPVCERCNFIKKEKNFNIEEYLYPYNEGIEKERFFYYSYINADTIKIDYLKNNKKINNNFKDLMLYELYNCHNDVVYEIIQKYKQLNEMSEEYYENYGIKISKNEMKSLLGYVSLDKIKNASLGKLTNDILDEVSK